MQRFKLMLHTPCSRFALASNHQIPVDFFHYIDQNYKIHRCRGCGVIFSKKEENHNHLLDPTGLVVCRMDHIEEFDTDKEILFYHYCDSLHKRFENPDFKEMKKVEPPLKHVTNFHPFIQVAGGGSLSIEDCVNECQLNPLLCIVKVFCRRYPNLTLPSLELESTVKQMDDLLD